MNDDSEIYAPSLIKQKRHRATNAEMQHRYAALYNIVNLGKPMTVRQVFYQGTVHGIVEKEEAGCAKVGRALLDMRRKGQMPYSWITDNSRLRRKPETYSSLEEALRLTAQCYRRALWDDSDAYVEIWCEKDALTGVIYPVTDKYDVPLLPMRGYSSESFAYAAACEISQQDKPAYIYHFGDYDPSGQDAARDLEAKLRRLAPNAEIHFERMAVTPQQIRDWDLPSRPTKKSDTRAKKFESKISVELDAIHPDMLRNMVEHCITRQMCGKQLEVILEAEESERALLRAIAGMHNWTELAGRV